MTDETIVAVFDTAATADAAVRDLQAVQVPADAISRHSQTSQTTGTVAAGTGAVNTAEPPRERGFWSSLFGGEPDYDPAVYDRSVQSGGVVLTIKADSGRADRIMEILERHNPVDLNERAASYGLATTGTMATGTAGRAASGASPGGTLELSEETLSVGKRAVNRGTTRVHRFVVETPVEQQVTLRDEKVTIERRPVTDGRTAGAADFSDKVVEMTETGEEAVVSKTARVREEVVVGKTATERTETVRDTVRREDVKIEGGAERAPGKPPLSGAPAAREMPKVSGTTGALQTPRAGSG